MACGSLGCGVCHSPYIADVTEEGSTLHWARSQFFYWFQLLCSQSRRVYKHPIHCIEGILVKKRCRGWKGLSQINTLEDIHPTKMHIVLNIWSICAAFQLVVMNTILSSRNIENMPLGFNNHLTAFIIIWNETHENICSQLHQNLFNTIFFISNIFPTITKQYCF